MRPRLTRELRLETRGGAPDGAGGRQGGWLTLGHHWCECRPSQARLEGGAGVTRAQVPWRITLKAVAWGAPSRPRAGQRFVSGERVWSITGVAEAGPRGEWLVCSATEEDAA